MHFTTQNSTAFKALVIILAFIFSDIICENFIVIINDEQGPFIANLLLFTFLCLQILFSPIQAGFSDSGRKNGLIISISVSFLSLICVCLYVKQILPILAILCVAIGLKGIWGNTIALSWAAIADTQDKNYRGSYALGSGVYAMSYLILIILRNQSISDSVLLYSTGAILLTAYLLGIFKFKDVEDRTITKDIEIEKIKKSSNTLLKYAIIFWVRLKKEKRKIVEDLKEKPTRQALLAYLLWSISMYSIVISQIDLHRNIEVNNQIAAAMMIGYLTGVVILKLKIINLVRDSIIVKWGYYISFYSLIPYFLVFPFINNANILLGACYYFHALGNSFLSPTLLTILSKEKHRHEQGKMLGLVESSDSIAFLLSAVAVIIYNYLRLHLAILVAFSFLSFAASWLFYGRFKDKDLTIHIG